MKIGKIYRPKHIVDKGNGRVFNGRKRIDDMYDGTWEKYRYAFLAINRLCFACGSLATVVDHLVPHKGDPVLFKKLDNHIPLCAKCHNTLTSLFDRDFKIGSSIQPKIQWIVTNRARNDLNTRVKVLPRYGPNEGVATTEPSVTRPFRA
jgi:hypothetical protein